MKGYGHGYGHLTPQNPSKTPKNERTFTVKMATKNARKQRFFATLRAVLVSAHERIRTPDTLVRSQLFINGFSVTLGGGMDAGMDGT